jgi:hypothetical protein
MNKRQIRKLALLYGAMVLKGLDCSFDDAEGNREAMDDELKRIAERLLDQTGLVVDGFPTSFDECVSLAKAGRMKPRGRNGCPQWVKQKVSEQTKRMLKDLDLLAGTKREKK